MSGQEITLDGARRLTERIRLVALNVGEGIDKLKALATEARAADVHTVLGYASWQAYLADVLGDTPLRLERDTRKELSVELTALGMSTRAIAPILGISHMQVKRDIDAGVTNVTPEPFIPTRVPHPLSDEPGAVTKLTGTNPAAESYWSPEESFVGAHPITGEVIEPAEPAARTVGGLDGKTYTVTPAAPRRKPLTDAAKDIGWEIRKATEKLQRITNDDRFTRNKEEVAAHIRGHLMFAVEACQDLLDNLNQSQED